MRIQKKRGRDGEPRYYASLVEGRRVEGKVAQTTIAYLGRVDEDQVPYLKAAYMDPSKRPRLVWDDERQQQ